MKKYELLFIIDSVVEEERKQTILEMVKETISTDGEVEKVDVWGNKKLAYPIEKKNDGYYILVTLKASTDLPKEINRKLGITEDVMRYLITDINEK